MKRLSVAALALLLVLPTAHAATDYGSPASVSAMFNHESCQVEPGQDCHFLFTFTNPYPEWMNETNLSIEIYRFATAEETLEVDESWPHAEPSLNETGERSLEMDLGNFPPGWSGNLTFTIRTSFEMPHGNPLSQGSYFLRFWIEFAAGEGANATRLNFASFGHFSRAQLLEATREAGEDGCPAPWCRGDVNITLLGVDGLIPDSAFGVSEPFPVWPFWLMGVGTVFFLGLAFLYHVEENPGTFPRTERAWARVKGTLRTMRPRRSK